MGQGLDFENYLDWFASHFSLRKEHTKILFNFYI